MPANVYVIYVGEGGPQATGAQYRIMGMPGTLNVTYTATMTSAPGSTLTLGHGFDGSGHSLAWASPQPFDQNGNLLDAATLIDDRHNQFQVAVNGRAAVPIQVTAASDATGADEGARLASLCAAIQAQVRAAAEGDPALAGFTCAPAGTSIRMTSGRGGEASSVRVLRGARNDLSAALRLGPDNGGEQGLFVSKMVIERAACHPGCRHNLWRRRRSKAFLREQKPRGIHERLPHRGTAVLI